MRIKVTSLLIYVIVFYSALRNSNIYIFGIQNAPSSIILDYLYLLILFVVLLILIIKNVISKNFNIPANTTHIIILFMWVLLQSVLNSFISRGNMVPRNLLSGLLTFIIMYLGIENQKQLNNAFKFFILGSVVSVGIPLLKFYSVIGIRTTIYQGVYYPGGLWSSALSSFTSIGWLILAFVQKKEVSGFLKIISIMSFGILLLGGLSGVSRALFVSLLISIIAYGITTKRLKIISQIILMSSLFIYGIELMAPDTIGKIVERLVLSAGNIREEERIRIWTTYLSNFKNYFLLGAFGDYHKYGPEFVEFGTHSVFLNWLVQFGLVGLFTFLGFLKRLLKKTYLLRKNFSMEYPFIVAWIIGYLIQVTISETGFYEVSYYVGLCFVMMWGRFNEAYLSKTDGDITGKEPTEV